MTKYSKLFIFNVLSKNKKRNHLDIAKVKLLEQSLDVDDFSILDIAGHLQHVVDEAMTEFTQEHLTDLFL